MQSSGIFADKLLYIMPALLLKNVPEPIRKILIKEQARQKDKIGSNVFGLEQTIYRIIKDWNEKCRSEKQ